MKNQGKRDKNLEKSRFWRRIYRLADHIYWRDQYLQKTLDAETWRCEVRRLFEDAIDEYPTRKMLRRAMRRLARRVVRNAAAGAPSVEDLIRRLLPRARAAAAKALLRFKPELLMLADVTKEDVALDAAWRVVREGLPGSDLRKQARRAAVERFVEGMRGFNPPGEAEPYPTWEHERPTGVRMHLARRAGLLPEPDRSIIRLRLNGLNFSEIGRLLGRSRQSVSQRFHRSAQRLADDVDLFSHEPQTAEVAGTRPGTPLSDWLRSISD